MIPRVVMDLGLRDGTGRPSVALSKGSGKFRKGALRIQQRKPRLPDGVIEDGFDGTCIGGSASGEELGSVQPGNWWRQKPKVQIAHVKEALGRLSRALWVWGEAAEAAFVPGQRSEADEVLAGLWKRRELRLRQLKWLRSEIPVDPVTGKDLEGEEEEKGDADHGV